MTISILPTPAAVLDAKVDVGAKTSTDVKVDNSDQNIVTGTINLEQSMGTIFLVFTILLIRGHVIDLKCSNQADTCVFARAFTH